MGSETKPNQHPTVIFYGGTFDPPHLGHQRLVQNVLDRFPESRVWISVAPAPAGAGELHKAPSASFEQRLAMSQLNFADALRGGRVELSDLESRLPAPNYTVDTLRYCESHYPQERWALLLGQDQLEQFSAWRHPKEILQIADLLVIGRGQRKTLAAALKELAQTLNWQIEAMGPLAYRWLATGTQVHILPEAVSDAASRVVRQDPRAQNSKDWLLPTVAAYIERQRLYQK